MESFQRQANDVLLKSELESCHGELHKLAGSFGMYGYTEVSETCRASMAAISSASVNEALTLLKKISALLEEFDD